MSSPSAPGVPFAAYRGSGSRFDELASETGARRPHYERLIGSLESLGAEELGVRLETARRSIRENDVTYNVYGDPQGMDRPWELDLVPLVLSADTWARLEAGLEQRARLLNLILEDLYGEQRLVHEGRLPPALVFGNPAFLRPCHGVRTPGGVRIQLHATDLVRGPDGDWWALADRTQAPSGAGYALENRIVLSHTLPEAFRDCRVQRLAGFFRILRERLLSLAPVERDNPTVVLLTAGPHNETYFEHAYLARYLGFTLVEGGDLTVRDRAVFLKTVEGLRPVDVVVRRLDDSFCDPLELRADSFLGVAGLVEATRAGSVTLANALGSGLVETPAILAFLPGLCRHLLGEDLKVPSVATWWCGQEAEREYVIAHVDELVVKPAFVHDRREPIVGALLSQSAKQALADEIRARPLRFVGQTNVALSTAPVWLASRLEPRAVLLRAFACAAGEGYAVMPGALTRVASSEASSVVSAQQGGSSKDTWVLAEGPISPVTLLAPGGPVVVQRAPADLPSRVAENLFWLGRYAERLESLVRLLRAALTRVVDAASVTDAPELDALAKALATLGLVGERPAGGQAPADLERTLLASVFRESSTQNLREALGRLRHVAWLVRDRLSVDTWRILNQLHSEVRVRASRERPGEALALLNRMIMKLAAFAGMEMENMTRGDGWRFLDIGRRLERAINLVSLIRASLPSDAHGPAALWPLIEFADSSMTYRRRYYAQPEWAPVLDLLLTDAANPRSLAFQLEALADHVDGLPRDSRAPSPSREQQILGRMSVNLRTADIARLCEERIQGESADLEALLDAFVAEASALSDTIAHYYFSHAIASVS